MPSGDRGIVAKLRGKGWAVGLPAVTVVVILLVFGVMSTNAGTPSLAQARSAQPNGFGRTPLPSSTPVPTLTFTPTPGPGTPTAVPKVSCPTAGCPYTVTPTGTWQVDQIWYGQTPRGGGTDKPVLFFVHGISGIASDWWGPTAYDGPNDMYTMAYNAGYRTAFVTVQQEPDDHTRGPYLDEYHDGPNIAIQINTVLSHYNVNKLEVIGHSKGGIDLQDALWEQQQVSHVNHFFMLSSPNTGSELATIECTPPAGGQQLSAVCSVDPYYMSFFRSTTDPKINQNPIPMFVSGGTDHGPTGSILYLGGQILNQYGANDGFVTVSSATTLTKSKYMFVRSVNHDSILIGHNSFPFIQSILEAGTPVAATPSR